MASDLETAWAAGLFEGEGCICIATSTRNGRLRRYVRLQLGMKDQDVVERFARFAGCGTVRFRTRHLQHWSDIYEWSVVASPEVRALLTTFIPMLGQRRREKAIQALLVLADVIPAAKNRTHCAKGHPYDEENTRLEGDGTYTWRRCRACKREYDSQRSLVRA